MMFHKDQHLSSKALIGAGIVHILPWLVYLPLWDYQFDLETSLRVGGCIVFILLGIAARWRPLIPSVFGLTLYAAFLVWQQIVAPSFHVGRWITQGPLLLLLILAVVSAARRDVASKPL